MSAGNQSWDLPNVTQLGESGIENWYAVHTRARHERTVAHRLRDQGVNTFLPLVTEVHRWSDRRKSVEVPLFGCYVFVKLPPTGEHRLRVLRIDGVLKFVGTRGVEGEFRPFHASRRDAGARQGPQGSPYPLRGGHGV